MTTPQGCVIFYSGFCLMSTATQKESLLCVTPRPHKSQLQERMSSGMVSKLFFSNRKSNVTHIVTVLMGSMLCEVEHNINYEELGRGSKETWERFDVLQPHSVL